MSLPFCGIFNYVIPYSLIFRIISDYMIIKKGLPYRFIGCVSEFIDLFCCRRFKTCNKR